MTNHDSSNPEVTCPRCKGEGAIPAAYGTETCPDCKGTGAIRNPKIVPREKCGMPTAEDLEFASKNMHLLDPKGSNPVGAALPIVGEIGDAVGEYCYELLCDETTYLERGTKLTTLAAAEAERQRLIKELDRLTRGSWSMEIGRLAQEISALRAELEHAGGAIAKLSSTIGKLNKELEHAKIEGIKAACWERAIGEISNDHPGPIYKAELKRIHRLYFDSAIRQLAKSGEGEG